MLFSIIYPHTDKILLKLYYIGHQCTIINMTNQRLFKISSLSFYKVLLHISDSLFISGSTKPNNIKHLFLHYFLLLTYNEKILPFRSNIRIKFKKSVRNKNYMFSISHYTHIHRQFLIKIKNNVNSYATRGYRDACRSTTDCDRLNLALRPFGFEACRKTVKENFARSVTAQGQVLIRFCISTYKFV